MLLKAFINAYLRKYASQSNNWSRLPIFIYTANDAVFDNLEINLLTFLIPEDSWEWFSVHIYFVRSLIISFARLLSDF